MKKAKVLVALMLILTLVMTLALTGCSKPAEPAPAEEPADETSEEAEEPADETSEEAEEPAEPEFQAIERTDNMIVIGNTTEANGDWGYALWANNATDALIRDLIDDCQTVVPDNGGDYVWNESVVESHEEVDNGDSKTWTIKIKPGLLYNNGEEIKAGDFLAWTLFCCTPLSAEMGGTSIVYQQLKGGPEFRNGETKAVSGLRLIDENTIEVTVVKEFVTMVEQAKLDEEGNPIPVLDDNGEPAKDEEGNDVYEMEEVEEVTTYLPYYFDVTYASLRAVNPTFWFGEGWTVMDDGEGAYLANANDPEMAFNADTVGKRIEEARFQSTDRVSAGPYYMVGFDQAASQITLQLNENYCGNFEGQKPDIKTLVIAKVNDDTVMDLLATGQIDMYENITDGDMINAALDLIDNGTIDAGYCRYDRAGYGKIEFMCDFGPTQFVEVRQALAHLLDRTEFANTFCQGWGSVVHGPYGTAFNMTKDSTDLFAKELNTYEYSLDKAIECLEAAGFTLGEDGNEYSGTGLRYKEVTPEEAGDYQHNIEVNGKVLMPAIIEWASSEGNSVSDLIATMLQENTDLASAGMKLNRAVMPFSELLNYRGRDASQGDKYGVPTYGMFNLATNFSAGYDMSYSFTLDPKLIEQRYNITRIQDVDLDKLSMDMVYGVEAGDYATYLDYWQKFIIRWNELLPELPLYSNVYVTVYPNTIENYEQSSFRTVQKAILYAKWVGKN